MLKPVEDFNDGISYMKYLCKNVGLIPAVKRAASLSEKEVTDAEVENVLPKFYSEYKDHVTWN